MKNYSGEKNSRKIGLFVLILLSCVAVGYAIVTQILTINGTSNVAGTWDVGINACGFGPFEKAVLGEATISPDKSSVTFNVDLKAPGGYGTYNLIVMNSGTIGATLNGITGLTAVNAALPTELKYTITDQTTNAVITEDQSAATLASSGFDVSLPGGLQERTYLITVTWDPESTSIPATTTKTATITFNYVQTT